jgi:acetolactate synthase-1/2/3 large subunit
MSAEFITKPVNPSQHLHKNTGVPYHHISREHSGKPSTVSSPTAPSLRSPNGKLNQESSDLTVAAAVVKMLEDLGVRYAFGLFGGGITPLIASLEQSSIQVLQFRHETGAAFAAMSHTLLADSQL